MVLAAPGPLRLAGEANVCATSQSSGVAASGGIPSGQVPSRGEPSFSLRLKLVNSS